LQAGAAAPLPADPADAIEVLRSTGSGAPPVWAWICVGLGAGLILGGAAVALGPRLLAKKAAVEQPAVKEGADVGGDE
ncbi:MAG: hypothetical protein ACHQ7M_20020, partial [Chloroflexota bacterium]